MVRCSDDSPAPMPDLLVARISDLASTNVMPVGAALRGRPQIRASGTSVGGSHGGPPLQTTRR
jgi:hypothetical protein